MPDGLLTTLPLADPPTARCNSPPCLLPHPRLYIPCCFIRSFHHCDKTFGLRAGRFEPFFFVVLPSCHLERSSLLGTLFIRPLSVPPKHSYPSLSKLYLVIPGVCAFFSVPAIACLILRIFTSYDPGSLVCLSRRPPHCAEAATTSLDRRLLLPPSSFAPSRLGIRMIDGPLPRPCSVC